MKVYVTQPLASGKGMKKPVEVVRRDTEGGDQLQRLLDAYTRLGVIYFGDEEYAAQFTQDPAEVRYEVWEERPGTEDRRAPSYTGYLRQQDAQKNADDLNRDEGERASYEMRPRRTIYFVVEATTHRKRV